MSRGIGSYVTCCKANANKLWSDPQSYGNFIGLLFRFTKFDDQVFAPNSNVSTKHQQILSTQTEFQGRFVSLLHGFLPVRSAEMNIWQANLAHKKSPRKTGGYF
jgi:hypothetical protein